MSGVNPRTFKAWDNAAVSPGLVAEQAQQRP